MGQGKDFKMPVLRHMLVKVGQQNIGFFQPGGLLQAIGCTVLHGHAGNDTQGAEADPCRIKQLRVRGRIHIHNVARWCYQPQGRDITRQALEVNTRAVGGGGRGPGQGLAINIRQVKHGLARSLQWCTHVAQARAGTKGGG